MKQIDLIKGWVYADEGWTFRFRRCFSCQHERGIQIRLKVTTPLIWAERIAGNVAIYLWSNKINNY